jgi:2-methylcitrate dehydratase PrpD
MGISEQFAANVVKTGFNSLDELTVSRARWRVLDAVGCAIAGADAAGCKAMLTLVKQWGGAAESTVFVYGVKAPAHHAAMMNSLMTRSFDFEPVDAEGDNKSSPAHISGTTVPTALAMAEYQGASGKALITALVAGDDMVCRLGVASGFDFDLGWDNTGTINGFGATAVAGKLLGLDEKQFHNAFGIVLNSLAGTMDGVVDKSMSFKLPIALSARNGIFAAELARQGFAGVKDPFTGTSGFFKLYCRNADWRDIVKNLGNRFYADAIYKPYSACRMTHSSIDSALKIARGNVFKEADIKAVEVLVTPGVCKGFCSPPLTLGETPQIDAAFNISYTVACALLRKDVQPDHFTEAAIRHPEIQSLIKKISLIPSIPADKGMATEIHVTMKDGRTLKASTDFPTGHYLKTPLTGDEIKAKYRNNVAFSKTVPAKKADKALELILKLEELEDVRELTALLVK